jgi:hypothetical protein
LKNSAQCRAAQQVFYKLFILKIIPKLQLKLCTLYVVHFLPVLDFRAALNPSIVSADVVLVGSWFQSLFRPFGLVFLFQKLLELFSFPILWLLAYLMMAIPETCHVP